MAASGAHKCPKSEKLDEAQALAKSCAGRPDFLPCDGLSICATHSHGKCFKLHWCCHLGWCHCKFLFFFFKSALHKPSNLKSDLKKIIIEKKKKKKMLLSRLCWTEGGKKHTDVVRCHQDVLMSHILRGYVKVGLQSDSFWTFADPLVPFQFLI